MTMFSPFRLSRRYLRSFASGPACRWCRALPIVLIICYFLFYKWKRIVPESWYFVNRLRGSTLPSRLLWRALEKEVNSTKIHFPVDVDAISGCKLSILDPWDPNILPYVKVVPSIHCPSDQRSILYTQDNRLLVNSTALTEDGKVRDEVVCTYRYIVSSDDLDTYGFSKEMTLQGQQVELDERYVSVSVRCLQHHWLTSITPQIVWRVSGLEFYRNILFYVPQPTNTSSAATAPSQPSERYSVFIFIIDGMSQMNYLRSLPKTAHLLTNSGSNLFSGYHRVGRNSYPNVMALLSGETGGNNCWLTQDSCDEKEKSKMYYIDVERQTILPTLYRSHNYKTMLLEDSQLVSTFHRPGRIGFKRAPAQMYFRASYLAMENEGHHLNTQIGEHTGGFGCLHNQLMHKHQFRLIEDFMETYKNEDYFAHIHLGSYLHNNLNMAKLYDEDLFLLLKTAISKGNLGKTFFLLMGDHGFQRGEEAFTLTSQGRQENNLPLLTILPPPSFVSRHPDLATNLAANQDKLTSHFDTNQFLRDILALGLNQSRSQLFLGYEGHGQSLLSPLGTDRSCRSASIPLDYCTCQEATKPLQQNSSGVMSLASAVLSDLNSMLRLVPLCKPLVLLQVHSAGVREAGSGGVTETGQSLFSVHLLVEMMEQVMLEVVVEVEGRKLGTVHTTRLDWYSDKSSCVPAALQHLRPFCVCY